MKTLIHNIINYWENDFPKIDLDFDPSYHSTKEKRLTMKLKLKNSYTHTWENQRQLDSFRSRFSFKYENWKTEKIDFVMWKTSKGVSPLSSFNRIQCLYYRWKHRSETIIQTPTDPLRDASSSDFPGDGDGGGQDLLLHCALEKPKTSSTRSISLR